MSGHARIDTVCSGCGETFSAPPRKVVCPKCSLTPKNLLLLELLSQDMPRKDIAIQLKLSEGTIKSYVAILSKKLNCRSVIGLVVWHLKHKKGDSAHGTV